MDYFSSVLISLTHFCDKHGPRIISVTQCSSISGNDRNNITVENQQSNNNAVINNDNSESNSGTQDSVHNTFNTIGGEELLVPNYPIDSYCESCLLQFPSISDLNNDNDPENHNVIRSMRTILNDHAFVTTQYSSIRFQKLNSIARKVFSEETMIYDCSPFIFYDDIRGLNLSMGFKLYDENARGNERRYCLILTIDQSSIEFSMNLLSQNWNFILLGFRKIINHIKELHQNVTYGSNNDNLSKNQLANNGNTLFISNYLRANKTKIAKNLVTLTNDNSIFIKLHKWNAYLISSLINTNHSISNINIDTLPNTNNTNNNHLIL